MSDSLDIDGSVKQATEQYMHGDLDAAERSCAEVLRAAPGQFEALYLTALIRQRTGRV